MRQSPNEHNRKPHFLQSTGKIRSGSVVNEGHYNQTNAPVVKPPKKVLDGIAEPILEETVDYVVDEMLHRGVTVAQNELVLPSNIETIARQASSLSSFELNSFMADHLPVAEVFDGERAISVVYDEMVERYSPLKRYLASRTGRYRGSHAAGKRRRSIPEVVFDNAGRVTVTGVMALLFAPNVAVPIAVALGVFTAPVFVLGTAAGAATWVTYSVAKDKVVKQIVKAGKKVVQHINENKQLLKAYNFTNKTFEKIVGKKTVAKMERVINQGATMILARKKKIDDWFDHKTKNTLDDKLKKITARIRKDVINNDESKKALKRKKTQAQLGEIRRDTEVALQGMGQPSLLVKPQQKQLVTPKLFLDQFNERVGFCVTDGTGRIYGCFGYNPEPTPEFKQQQMMKLLEANPELLNVTIGNQKSLIGEKKIT